MISNDERREIAARLMREACAWKETFPESECDFSDAAAMMQDLCVFIGLERNTLCSEVFKRLADLIDRPITTRHGKFRTKYGRETPCCEVCGYSIGDMRWNYCPKCGAEVMG